MAVLSEVLSATESAIEPSRGVGLAEGADAFCPFLTGSASAIAHRGAGRLAPENTLAALRRGFELGYRLFEFDVRLSADGVPFLMHDDDLDRTSNGSGPSGVLPWAELSGLDAGSWHSAAYAAEPIPKLDRVLRFLQTTCCGADIEIKPTPGTERATGRVVADLVARWVGRTRPARMPLLSSFSVAALEAAGVAASELPRGLLLERWQDGAAQQALDLGCRAVIPPQAALTESRVDRLREAGLTVLTYTVNDAERARLLWSWGVHGLCTDAVDRIPGTALPAEGLE